MLQSYFDYIFVHLRQKVRLRPELSPKFLSTLGSNPARTRARPEKPAPTYNFEMESKDSSKLQQLLPSSVIEPVEQITKSTFSNSTTEV